jgi:hypothetical protein
MSARSISANQTLFYGVLASDCFISGLRPSDGQTAPYDLRPESPYGRGALDLAIETASIQVARLGCTGRQDFRSAYQPFEGHSPSLPFRMIKDILCVGLRAVAKLDAAQVAILNKRKIANAVRRVSASFTAPAWVSSAAPCANISVTTPTSPPSPNHRKTKAVRALPRLSFVNKHGVGYICKTDRDPSS